ncbi:Uncharacterized protein TCM_025209 [Theobroma cacao]|uniref:Uncharacterized protein n=1 Tax=Theobroma cacao TaxID=3641 RepID=A0A061EYU6_THECC|nr:Uncharacterized protein TCM_025209 [Theobroma cacao]
MQCLKTLEGELEDKLYFGGEGIGFMDVGLVPFTPGGNFSIKAGCPKLPTWAKRCKENESVFKALSHPHKIYGFFLEHKEKLELN